MVKILKIKECTRVVLGYCRNPLGFGSIEFVIVVQRGYQSVADLGFSRGGGVNPPGGA